MEFHIARAFRDSFDLRDLLFSYTGNVIFANVAASRRLAAQMNDARVAEGGPAPEQDPKSVVHAGQLFAMGLIDELSHAVIEHYRKEQDPTVLADALKWFARRAGTQNVDALLLAFTERFPNTAIYTGKLTAAEWLAGSTGGLSHREAALEELLLLWLANANPAYKPFRTLFDDTALQKSLSVYTEFQADAEAYFETRPEFSPEAKTLLEALRAPIAAAPDSLSGQLDFIREKWLDVLGPQAKATLTRTLLAVDTLREEEVAIWMQFNPPGHNVRHHGPLEFGGKEGFIGDEYIGFNPSNGLIAFWEETVRPDGTIERRRRFRTRSGLVVDSEYAHDYQAPLNEYEAFSHDDAWMPNVVLMAKSTYVWLEQLSKKYRRHIHRLDQIPLEELQLLRDRGMTGLWLIGLWERSKASQTIKRLRGAHDAVASAYSLMDYRIAEDLGGDEAYSKLRDLAGTVGLRLASDMVPNHMGLDSTWVIEHPEWFLRRPESPYPSYTFEGPDLSQDPRVEIKIEDHYYDQTDAAVVYRVRYRDASNRTEFIYHGNDGTTFAWNDTAQLDYSQHAVREHVIQVILEVARRFPIIRFDAAMVLAKRHVQRLWFPLPGVGGSIPSRAEDAMTQEDFDHIMPQEFWREVVDRVQREVPGTLLLAEAFWLLEGYFVRTLGMHRVYNSAFMVMLRDEENAKYRSYLKKTVEFDPDIMKRYVNFMSNPDEKTAIAQFGTGDKFFGVATVMATIPGLPMFGHGQIEGYTEKYGMEYKTAKFDEWPNDDLVSRHMREIAPLLANRSLFAESENFVFFDFWTEHHGVDENVFAYSNRLGNQRALILYNNTISSTRGTVHVSAASMNKWTGDLWQRSLADALALPSGDEFFLAWRDTATGLEYIRRANDLVHHGLTMDLRGYQYAVLLHWRDLRSTATQPWDQLCNGLHGAGVHSLDEALTHLRLRPLTAAIRSAAAWDAVRLLAPTGEHPMAETEAVRAWGQHAKPVFERWHELESPALSSSASPQNYAAAATTAAERILKAVAAARESNTLPPHTHPEALWSPLLTVLSLRTLPPTHQTYETAETYQTSNLTAPTASKITAPTAVENDRPAAFQNIIDRLGLRSSLAELFSEMGMHGEDSWRTAARVRLALGTTTPADPAFWQDPDVYWLIGANQHEGTTYLNEQALTQLLHWLALAGTHPIDTAAITTAATTSNYKLDTFRKTLFPPPAPSEPEPTPTAPNPAAPEPSAAPNQQSATATQRNASQSRNSAAPTKAAKKAVKQSAPDRRPEKKSTVTKSASAETTPGKAAEPVTPTESAAGKQAAPAAKQRLKSAKKLPASAVRQAQETARKKSALAKKPADKLAASPVTVQPASILQTPPVDGYPVIDTAAIPNLTQSPQAAATKSPARQNAPATPKKAAAKNSTTKSRAGKQTPPM